MYKIKTFNAIANVGLEVLAADNYQVSAELNDPDALLLRSQPLSMEMIPDSVQAVARAGVGVNNIPVTELSESGIPVFNSPGANANAVKELVISGMLLAARNICQAWDFVQHLEGDDASIAQAIEQHKKQFAGVELPGKTLAVIGLGAIGVLVANAASQLGMRVIGFDPMITIHRAWQLSSDVQQAQSIIEAVQQADFITVHVPLTEQTHHLLNSETMNPMRPGTVLLNFARGAIVDETAVCAAIDKGTVQRYVCDFPSQRLQAQKNVIALPHLGASTREAEENCAIIAAKQLRDYLEQGTIGHSVNFPSISMPRSTGIRLAITHRNVPNMLGQISTVLAQGKINIIDMINKSRAELAYTLLDINDTVSQTVLHTIQHIDGVLRVRVI